MEHAFLTHQKNQCGLQVSVNELPYSLRKNNMILAGLWIGEGSPRMDVFLKPFIEELITLHNEGITCSFFNKKNVNIKVHTLIASVDSVARPKVNAELIYRYYNIISPDILVLNGFFL